MNDLMKIVEFSEFDKQLAEFKDRYENVVYNLDDPTQNKQARSDKFAIGKVISKLDRTHKELKAPLKERVDLIDGERKRIKDQLLRTQGKIKAQIEDHEARKKAIADAIEARIAAIYALATDTIDGDSAEIKQRIEALERIDPESVDFDSRNADAALAVRKVGNELAQRLADVERYEAEQAELARLRAEEEKRIREEREARIRKEAEDRAKREAEALARKKAAEAEAREQALKEEREAAKRRAAKAEQARKDAIEQAKRDAEKAEQARKEAIETAKRLAAEAKVRAEQEAKQAAERAAQLAATAERNRLEALRREEEAKAEKARKEAQRKAERKEHREKVERDALKDIISIWTDLDLSPGLVLQAIKDGKIRRVRIEY